MCSWLRAIHVPLSAKGDPWQWEQLHRKYISHPICHINLPAHRSSPAGESLSKIQSLWLWIRSLIWVELPQENSAMTKHPKKHRWLPSPLFPPGKSDLYHSKALADFFKVGLRLGLLAPTLVTNPRSERGSHPHRLALPLMQCFCKTTLFWKLRCMSWCMFTHVHD